MNRKLFPLLGGGFFSVHISYDLPDLSFDPDPEDFGALEAAGRIILIEGDELDPVVPVIHLFHDAVFIDIEDSQIAGVDGRLLSNHDVIAVEDLRFH